MLHHSFSKNLPPLFAIVEGLVSLKHAMFAT